MNDAIQSGRVLELTAPSAGVVSGTAYKIGSLVVVATESKAETLKFNALVVGVADLTKVADEIWTEGEKVYWDDSAKKVTTVSGGNTLIGTAVYPIDASVLLSTDAAADGLTVEGAVITVVDYQELTGKTITVQLGRTSNVLTEGVDFDAETDNATTANNIATAVAALAGATTDTDTDDDEITVIPGTGADDQDPAVGRVRLDGGAR